MTASQQNGAKDTPPGESEPTSSVLPAATLTPNERRVFLCFMSEAEDF